MLILTQSQAKNYMSKSKSYGYNEGCGCCYSTTSYEIKGDRILRNNYGEHQGTHFFEVTVIAKIKKVKSN